MFKNILIVILMGMIGYSLIYLLVAHAQFLLYGNPITDPLSWSVGGKGFLAVFGPVFSVVFAVPTAVGLKWGWG